MAVIYMPLCAAERRYARKIPQYVALRFQFFQRAKRRMAPGTGQLLMPANIACDDNRIQMIAIGTAGGNFLHHGQVILFLAPMYAHH
jgi:hypothetical protein